MKPILEIQHISKKFMINHEQESYLSIRDSISRFFSTTFVKPKRNEEFWALSDVSFDVMPGDTIGIVGKNGAGKSTLLKILSKITPPTSGKIIGRGRIASLLEVGTGFHPELSGRENIFMNGSILGMRKSEIMKNFDAIVDFAGVQKFIDTPLKHYSSGMQLRLAFAVAAFLENEILIIDEVLAVGDAEFQKKCMGKMNDISKSGRTILFVSHNTFALSQLCEKCFLLQKGSLIKSGSTNEVIDYYNHEQLSNSIYNSEISIGKNIDIIDFYINEKNSEISFKIYTKEVDIITGLTLYLNSADGYRVAIIDCRTISFPLKAKAKGSCQFHVEITNLPIVEGTYYIGLYLETNFFNGNTDNLFQINVPQKTAIQNIVIAYPKQHRGVVELDYKVTHN